MAAESSRRAAAQQLAAAGSSGSSQQRGAAALVSQFGSYVAKLRQGDEAVWEKDELLNLIYVWRQVTGVGLGIVAGVLPLTGITGVLLFLMLSFSLTMTLYRNMLGIDEEEYGGHSELVFEGLGPSFASYLVCWILAYTALHHNS